jgi:hypothetical protein
MRVKIRVEYAFQSVAVTFSAPAFAGDDKEKKDDKKGGK